MDKEDIRKLNRVTSIQVIILIIATNIAIGILAFNVVHVYQSDFSKLDRNEIQGEIDRLQIYGNDVCIETSRISTDGESWANLKSTYGSNIKSKCLKSCLCFEIS